jgi:hypothetical protein
MNKYPQAFNLIWAMINFILIAQQNHFCHQYLISYTLQNDFKPCLVDILKKLSSSDVFDFCLSTPNLK